MSKTYSHLESIDDIWWYNDFCRLDVFSAFGNQQTQQNHSPNGKNNNFTATPESRSTKSRSPFLYFRRTIPSTSCGLPQNKARDKHKAVSWCEVQVQSSTGFVSQPQKPSKTCSIHFWLRFEASKGSSNLGSPSVTGCRCRIFVILVLKLCSFGSSTNHASFSRFLCRLKKNDLLGLRNPSNLRTKSICSTTSLNNLLSHPEIWQSLPSSTSSWWRPAQTYRTSTGIDCKHGQMGRVL